MRNKKLAAYVRHAADNVLSTEWFGANSTFKYSCDALFMGGSAFDEIKRPFILRHTQLVYLRVAMQDMGLDYASLYAFHDIPEGPERQGARYLWLQWLALMIEEGVI